MANEPAAPILLPFEEVGVRSVLVSYQLGAANGSPIDQVQIGYGTDSNMPQKYVGVSGPTTIGGLSAFANYFFWVRAHNANGWSVLSARSALRTSAGVNVRVNNVWHHALVYIRVDGQWRLAQPFVKRAGIWKRCG